MTIKSSPSYAVQNRVWRKITALPLVVGFLLGLLVLNEPTSIEALGVWHIRIVDAGLGTWSGHTSLALDGDGYPHISYFDSTNEDLKYAYQGASGWHIETVDTGLGFWGGYTSLALDGNGYPHISYHDDTNGDLKYAYQDTSGWHIETVDSEGDVGHQPSLSLDAGEYAHISYYDHVPNRDLKCVYQDASGWNTDTVDTEGYVGEYNSIALDGDGHPHISYFDTTNEDLKYAYQDASGWHTETVDSEGDVGRDTSLALDGDRHPHISYFDSTNGALKHAWFAESGWHTETVDTELGPYSGDTSLTLDRDGNPHISYHDNSYPNEDLKYAYQDAFGWHTETVDSGGDVGRDTSLALDGDGYPHISYFDNGDLKYASRSAQATPTPTSTATPIGTPTATNTATLTPAATGTPTPCRLYLPVILKHYSPATLPTPTLTGTATTTLTPSLTPTITSTPTASPTPTQTPTRPPTPASIEFTENFSTTTYQDATNTTADWDTANAKLKLHSSMLVSKVGSLPTKRGFTSAIYAPSFHKAYIFGGFGEERFDDIVEYNLATGAVTVLEAKLPTPRSSTSAIYVSPSNKAYVFGGYDGACLDDIVEYDLTTDTVTVLEAKLPTARSDTSAIYVPSTNKAYVFGGWDGVHSYDDIVEYDLTSGTVTVLGTTLPTPRSSTSAIYVPPSNKAYVFGGYALDDIVEYDLATGTVTVLEAKLPTARKDTSAIYVPSTNKAYVFGGFGNPDRFDDIVGYDLASGTVTVLEARLPTPRNGTSAVYVSLTKAYVFGGADVAHLDDIVVCDSSYYTSQEQAQSLDINPYIYEVLTTTLTVSQTLHGQVVEYYLSNNGGTDWEAINPGGELTFSTIGTDLRWRAVLSSDGSDTPMVDSLTIVYSPNPYTPIPAAPVLYPIANEDTDGSYQVAWSAVDRVAYCVLEQATDSSFTDASVVYTGSDTSTWIIGRMPDTYYYRVQAVNAAGSSDWSNVEQVNVTKCLSAPVLAEIENDDGDGSYTVNWSGVTTAITYTLEEDTDISFTNPISYVVNTTSKSITGQEIGTYYYRVKAANKVCDSDWSNKQAVTVTTEAPVPEPGTWYGSTSWFKSVQFRVSSDSSSVRDLQLTLHDNCGVVTSAGPVPIENGHFSFGWFSGDFTATDEASGSYVFAGNTPNCGFVIETGSWDASH